MTTPAQIRAWLAGVDRDWYGACAGLAYNIIAKNGGEHAQSYSSATAAYNDTVIESIDPALAPPGAQHYWYFFGKDYRGIRGNWGHVATDIYGGGHSILSATSRGREYWGRHAGILSVAAQTVDGMRYLGWSRTFGRRARINIELPTPSGGGDRPAPTPTPTPTLEDDMTMELIEHAGADVQGGWYVAGPGHWHRLTPPELEQILVAGQLGDYKRRSTGGNWALLVRWHDVYAPIDIDLNGAKIGTAVDTETIAARAEAAVRGEVAELRALIEDAGITVDIDEDAIAQRVRDEFTARPLG